MKKVFKEVENVLGLLPVFAPSSKRDGKIMKIKYNNMDSYGTIRMCPSPVGVDC